MTPDKICDLIDDYCRNNNICGFDDYTRRLAVAKILQSINRGDNLSKHAFAIVYDNPQNIYYGIYSVDFDNGLKYFWKGVKYTYVMLSTIMRQDKIKKILS
jgi:hypothetical protein